MSHYLNQSWPSLLTNIYICVTQLWYKSNLVALQYHLRPWCLFSTKPFLYENLLSFRPFGTNLIEIWRECFWHLQKLTFLFSPQCINPSVSLLHIYVTENNQHFSRHRCAFPNLYSPYRLPQGRQGWVNQKFGGYLWDRTQHAQALWEVAVPVNLPLRAGTE